MSLHNKPKYQIPELIESLKAHGLDANEPSQLSDAFRTGWVAARAALAAQPGSVGLTDEDMDAVIVAIAELNMGDIGYHAFCDRIIKLAAAPTEAKPDCAGGIACTTCPDKRKCQRGCIRQSEALESPNRKDLRAECDAVDALLRGLGLEPERCRTEGGALNVGRALSLLAYGVKAKPVAWGMRWQGHGPIMDCITPEEHERHEGEYTVPLFATPPTEAVRMSEAWIRVGDQMPPSGQTVLAFYRNSLGNGRRVRAQWVAAKSCESGSESDIGEYDEATDTYYDPEGWYEQVDNWDLYSAVAMFEVNVTHWMPLPPPPVEQATAARLGVKMGDV